MRVLLVSALVLAGWVVAGTATPAAPRTVACDRIILAVRSGTAAGYRVVFGRVSVPPAYLQQVVHYEQNGFPYWRKAGLVVRGGSPPVTVSVPHAWRSRAAITWGNAPVGTSLRIASCPALHGGAWNGYAGGFLLRSASACVPLRFQIGRRTTTVRFGIGRRC